MAFSADPLRRPRTSSGPRERAVLAAIAEGLTNKEIALQHTVSVKTIEAQVAHLMEVTGIHNRVRLARAVWEGRV